jgi:ABC-type uncharacterized transport system auxiliary subunit
MMPFAFRRPLAAALLSVLAGCTGSLFSSKEPPQSTYLLSFVPAPASAGPDAAAPASDARIPVDLTILRPQVRPGLDTRLIAVLYADRRLDHFSGARWSGPLDAVLQDLALQALRRDGRVRNVHSDASSFGTGYWLEIDVADFQAEYAGTAADSRAPVVHVHLVARLGASGDRHVVGQFEADVRVPSTENRLTAIVDAYDRAASAALDKIAAGVEQALRQP